jgi:hypothetical protein
MRYPHSERTMPFRNFSIRPAEGYFANAARENRESTIFL